jgi:hypothetical protein
VALGPRFAVRRSSDSISAQPVFDDLNCVSLGRHRHSKKVPGEAHHLRFARRAGTDQRLTFNRLAKTTAGTNVTVNSVLPGPTRSEGVEKFVEDLAKGQGTDAAKIEADFFRTARPSSLLKRFATLEEVAASVAYVCNPRA